jgi:NDP-sugar pyrophosphorylase family protein
MAGGIGSRLDPFTKVLPKPLVPVSGKPIIDHIIESFNMIGCSEFYLTTNYKKNILKAYFEDTQRSYKVNFVDENSPLGTAGSLKLLQGKFKNPFFVSNCDIIVKINYKSFYDFHIQGKYDITLVASTKEYIIPYGTCELNKNGYLSKINEKPKYNFLVNAGLYIINPETIKNIPNNKFYHITHLIESLIKKNKRVGVFPVDEDEWIDVGEWAEYKKAIKRL